MSREKEEGGAEAALGVLMSLASIPVNVILRGWALDLTWAWFLTAAFGWASPGRINCVGIAAILAFAVFNIRSHRKSDDDTALSKGIESLLCALLLPPTFVGICWVLVQVRGY